MSNFWANEVMNNENSLEQYVNILELAANKQLPNFVAAESDIHQLVCELVDHGYLSGVFANSTAGPAIFNPAITFEGRQYLANGKNSLAENVWWKRTWRQIKPAANWLLGIATAVIIGWIGTKLI